MTPLLEHIITGSIVAVAAIVVLWRVLLPRRLKQTLKLSLGGGRATGTDCGDDCNCGS